MDFETILYEIDGGKARITLNRPEKLNALSMRLQRELNAALWEADNDARVHVIILRAAGRAFSAGYDLTAMQSPPKREERDESYTNVYRGMASIDDDIWRSSGSSASAWRSSTCTSRSSRRCTATASPAAPTSRCSATS